ncbi:hypothetical protein B5V00_07850 [Geothermobacter hydrogeniphilus]|uniref:Uncharacterized protein n=1 Tax=Geothermobacter hydrogeniphilus TaxID=1969733 RepID=A0A1X0Y5S8_9BACT|nr:hypothetical protein B5V00_07850 [Geothermobacter hydrogeniphilus]
MQQLPRQRRGLMANQASVAKFFSVGMVSNSNFRTLRYGVFGRESARKGLHVNHFFCARKFSTIMNL